VFPATSVEDLAAGEQKTTSAVIIPIIIAIISLHVKYAMIAERLSARRENKQKCLDVQSVIAIIIIIVIIYLSQNNNDSSMTKCAHT